MTHPDQWLFKCNGIKARPTHKYLDIFDKGFGKMWWYLQIFWIVFLNSRVPILILYWLFTSVVSSVNNITHEGITERHYWTRWGYIPWSRMICLTHWPLIQSKCRRCFRSANIISKRPVQERSHLKGIWEKETTYILIYLEHFSWLKKGRYLHKISSLF